MNEIDVRDSQLTIKMEALDDYAKRTHLPHDVVSEVQNYLTNNSFNELNLGATKKILDELPETIKGEVAQEMYKSIIQGLKFFQSKNPRFLWEFMPYLNPFKAFSQDMLYYQGDHPEEIFFILQGRVKLKYDITEGLAYEPKYNIPFNMYT